MSKSSYSMVVIGGGGGTSQVILGSRPYFSERTAVLAVTDTGRSTGVARAIGSMPAPGDVRNTLATLASDPNSLFASLLQYRFHSSAVSQLEGMAFGNLLIAALTQMTGDFARAVEIVEEWVQCSEHVLPVSATNTHLCAELDDGRVMESELTVRGLNKAPIRRVFLADASAPAYPRVLAAIEHADLVVIGPGSFFTSVLATLLFAGVKESLHRTQAKVVFVCNTTTQPGQTDGYRAVDHVKRIVNLLGPGGIDIVLVNRSDDISPDILHRYAQDGVYLLQPDDQEIAEIAEIGVVPLVYNYTETMTNRRTLWNKQDTIRHSPSFLGKTLWEVVTNNGTDTIRSRHSPTANHNND
jgi:uncharacterized cofD-like protein